ncbi:hypothetical protein ACWHA1_36980, partial [Streptomyces decoyicus]
LQARMEKILNDAAETDRAATIALRHNTGKDNRDFNGKAVTSIDADEAARASNLLKKLDDDEKLSQHGLNELERVMSHNQRDPEFNTMLLNKLGPKKTLMLADELHQIRGDEWGTSEYQRKQYATIERSLANGVGAANQDKDFSEQWRKDMRELGPEKVTGYSGDSYQVDGYQALSDLLKHGSDAYPPHMTTGLTDDMMAAEKEHPGLWDEAQTIQYGADPKPGSVNDPVDDMLGVMSRDPATATNYLDPHGHNDRLKYLLDQRDWPDITVHEDSQRGDELRASHHDATNSRTGLGNVLEAATTGAEPGHERTTYGGHTAGQARVTQDTIERLDSNHGGDEIPKNMQRPLARALSDYTEDTHNIIAGGHEGYGTTKDGRPDAWHRGGESKYHIGVPEGSVLRVLRGVSDDPKNYAQIYEAERFYAAEQMARSPAEPGGAHSNWETPARDAGTVLGAYNAIGSDATLDERDGKKQWADDTAKYIYHGAGIPLTAVPVVGDTAQRMLDQGTYDWSKDVKSAADAGAAHASADKDAAGIDGTYDLINRWAAERDQDTESNDIRQVKQEAEQSYITSRESAFATLRGRY